MKTNLKTMDTFSTIIARLGLRQDGMNEEQKELVEELAATNERLLNAERVKSNFMSNIRNEINNPITSVLELSKKISEGKMDEKQIRKYADLIYLEAFSLDFQMRNIIAAAEIESGDINLSVARVNVYSLIFNTLQSFQHLIVQKDLKLSVNNSVTSTFCTDPEKLQLVLRNLIANAIEFNKQSASIEISSRLEAGNLAISVSDDGDGIDDEKKRVIYDRFHQLEEGVNKPHRGQGLGLSLVKSLLELLNGTLELKSTKEKGSVFTVRIIESEGEIAQSSSGNDFLFTTENEMVF